MGWTKRAALLALALIATVVPTASAGSLKGSSCKHPYRVEWAVEKFGKEWAIRWGGPESRGDTAFIKVHVGYNTRSGAVNFADASWRPRSKHLKVCLVRLTFNYRAPYVSHQWAETPVEFAYNPEAEQKSITSFVVTAARQR